jgi:hypothetical protein
MIFRKGEFPEDADIPFGLSSEVAGRISARILSYIGWTVDKKKKCNPVDVVNGIASEYKGSERDFAIYTAGRIYATFTTWEDFLDGKLTKKEDPSGLVNIMELQKLVEAESPDELYQKLLKMLEKQRRMLDDGGDDRNDWGSDIPDKIHY